MIRERVIWDVVVVEGSKPFKRQDKNGACREFNVQHAQLVAQGDNSSPFAGDADKGASHAFVMLAQVLKVGLGQLEELAMREGLDGRGMMVSRDDRPVG